MKKKITVSAKDKKDWITFTKQINNVSIKKSDILTKNTRFQKTPKLDLHGYSLEKANQEVKRFILETFNNGYKKIMIVTGKGSRSKSYDNPYISENLSVLKNSIPEYIKNDENLNSIINKIAQTERKDGGEGAINIYLKDKKITK